MAQGGMGLSPSRLSDLLVRVDYSKRHNEKGDPDLLGIAFIFNGTWRGDRTRDLWIHNPNGS